MTIDEQIAALKLQADVATASRYRAEAAYETAQKAYDEAMAALAEEFGLDNLGDARAKLAELEASIAAKVAEATAILDSHKL